MRKLFIIAFMVMLLTPTIDAMSVVGCCDTMVETNSNATNITLIRKTDRGLVIRRSATAEVIKGEVWVNGEYKARSASGSGYMYAVTMNGNIWYFDL